MGAPRNPFQYAIVRVVPDIARGECVNAGVVLMCRPKRYLGARVGLDATRMAAIAPGLSPAEVQSHLDAIVRIASGDPEGGPIAQLGLAERFHWLVAPSSTIIQTSETHTGLCHDPAASSTTCSRRLSPPRRRGLTLRGTPIDTQFSVCGRAVAPPTIDGSGR